MQQHKKGQGISINTLIIAAIALIVLVILIAIFVNKSNIFSGSVDDCPSKFKDASCATTPEQRANCGVVFGKIGCEGDAVCCVPKDKLTKGASQ